MELNTFEILFWAGAVFVSGFIAYFGKYLSKLILARIHKTGPEGKKDETHAKPPGTKEELEHELDKKRMKLEYRREKRKMKLEKKRLKAEKKAKD